MFDSRHKYRSDNENMNILLQSRFFVSRFPDDVCLVESWSLPITRLFVGWVLCSSYHYFFSLYLCVFHLCVVYFQFILFHRTCIRAKENHTSFDHLCHLSFRPCPSLHLSFRLVSAVQRRRRAHLSNNQLRYRIAIFDYFRLEIGLGDCYSPIFWWCKISRFFHRYICGLSPC
jgi:hypothetical protein